MLMKFKMLLILVSVVLAHESTIPNAKVVDLDLEIYSAERIGTAE
jgi:hypothetical protein